MQAVTQSPALDAPAVEVLLRGASATSGVDLRRTTGLGRTLLAPEPTGATRLRGRSGLNYDRTPIQLCLSADADGYHCRLLADPASTTSDPRRRYQASLVALDQTIERTDSHEMRELLTRTLQLNMPTAAEPFDYPDGVLWLAAGLGSPGIAMYMDARRGGRAVAAKRLLEWLLATTDDTDDVRTFVSALQSRANLLSLGIEGINPALSRTKVYWRMTQPSRLDKLGIAQFATAEFVEFLALALGKREIRLSGVVLNAAFTVSTGLSAGVKIDICGCPNCLAMTADKTAAVVDDITAAFGLAPLPVRDALEYGELAYLGFGLNPRGLPRLNVYLKALPVVP